ncbi:unnamed protein product, partial [marine sediment metagenome]
FPNYSAPSYDSVNKRVKFDTGPDVCGFSLRPKNVNVENYVLSFDFFFDSHYGDEHSNP